ncbi:MAG: hypothetical protein ACOZIN_17325 [Myxococcota bacterium]
MADLPPANLILQALHAIRFELRGLREGQEQTNARLDETNARLDETNASLNTRLTRLEKATTRGFIATNSKLASLALRVDNLAKKVSEHDRRLDHLLTKGLGAQVRTLQERVGRIEARLISPRAVRRHRRPRRK